MSAKRRRRRKDEEPAVLDETEVPGEVPDQEEVTMAEEGTSFLTPIEEAAEIEPETPPDETTVEEETPPEALAEEEVESPPEEAAVEEEAPPEALAEEEVESPPEGAAVEEEILPEALAEEEAESPSEEAPTEEKVVEEETAVEEVSEMKIETVGQALYQMGLEAGLSPEEAACQVVAVKLPAFVGPESVQAFKQAVVVAYEEGLTLRLAAFKEELGL